MTTVEDIINTLEEAIAEAFRLAESGNNVDEVRDLTIATLAKAEEDMGKHSPIEDPAYYTALLAVLRIIGTP